MLEAGRENRYNPGVRAGERIRRGEGGCKGVSFVCGVVCGVWREKGERIVEKSSWNMPHTHTRHDMQRSHSAQAAFGRFPAVPGG